jgi:hypothetical protein
MRSAWCGLALVAIPDRGAVGRSIARAVGGARCGCVVSGGNKFTRVYFVQLVPSTSLLAATALTGCGGHTRSRAHRPRQA